MSASAVGPSAEIVSRRVPHFEVAKCRKPVVLRNLSARPAAVPQITNMVEVRVSALNRLEAAPAQPHPWVVVLPLPDPLF